MRDERGRFHRLVRVPELAPGAASLGLDLRHGCIEERQRSQHEIVGVQALGALALHALDLGRPEAWLDRPNDCERQFVLQHEDIVESPIISFGPEMRPGSRIDKLAGDPHTVAGFAERFVTAIPVCLDKADPGAPNASEYMRRAVPATCTTAASDIVTFAGLYEKIASGAELAGAPARSRGFFG